MNYVSKFLKITNTTMYNDKVKSDIRITALGDLHLSEIVPTKVTDHLKYQLEKTQSQYHCLLGDLIDVPSDLQKNKIANQLLDFIKSSASMAPTIIVLGSHDFIDLDYQDHFDYDFWQEVSVLENVYLLNNAIYQTNNLFFMGYFPPYFYWYPCGNHVGQEKREDLEILYQDLLKRKNLFTTLPQDIPAICLMHSPEFYKDERIVSLLQDYDLILCGHYHNGMLPIFLDDLYSGNRGLISPKREKFPVLSRGMVTLSTGTKLMINSGITKIQYSASKKFRFFNLLCYEYMDTITLTGDSSIREPVLKRERVFIPNSLKKF